VNLASPQTNPQHKSNLYSLPSTISNSTSHPEIPPKAISTLSMCLLYVIKAIRGRNKGDTNNYNTRVVPTGNRPVSPRAGMPMQSGQTQGQQQQYSNGGYQGA
jgi:hypothetical protein